MNKDRKLIIANTFYQVIFAIQMKLTLFEKTDVEIIITDHSNNAEYISEKLREVAVFSNVYYIKTRGSSDNRNKLEKARDMFCISFLKNNQFAFYTEEIKNKFFDELIVFNYDMRIYGVFAILTQYNSELKLSRYEEGILSYDIGGVLFTSFRKIIGKLRKMQGKAVIEEAFSNFYCFYPDLYKGCFSAKRVPLINNSSPIKLVLQNVFEVSQSSLSYSPKYIFFTSVYDFEGEKPVGEYELVCKIAELVGKNNLLIKLHPRDKRTIYTDSGFDVDKNSSIPWEVIQLSGDFSDKVFMTINSGSVLSGSAMSEQHVKTYYMYKLCDISGNQPCQKNAHDIEEILNNEFMGAVFKNVKIAERLEDIL